MSQSINGLIKGYQRV